MTALVCSNCGASVAGGSEFLFIQTYTASATGIVNRSDPDGTLVVDWVDAGNMERAGRYELHCHDCGHQWRTRREHRSGQS